MLETTSGCARCFWAFLAVKVECVPHSVKRSDRIPEKLGAGAAREGSSAPYVFHRC